MQKTRTVILSYILLELSLLNSFHKRWFSLSCLGVQPLPFIDNSHLGSILRFQWFPCLFLYSEQCSVINATYCIHCPSRWAPQKPYPPHISHTLYHCRDLTAANCHPEYRQAITTYIMSKKYGRMSKMQTMEVVHSMKYIPVHAKPHLSQVNVRQKLYATGRKFGFTCHNDR